MKVFTISIASMLLATASFAQIPITSASPTPPTPPQPTLVNCSVAARNSLNNTNWAFMASGPVSSGTSNISQVGTFTILPNGFVTGRRTTNYQGQILERFGEFFGQIDIACLAGTGVPAAGTLQLGGGLGGAILTWSFPIRATAIAGGYSYNVTSVTTMNLRPYGALDPAGSPPGTNSNSAYGYLSTGYITTGTASLLVGQLPCPDPADAALDIFAPNGYTQGAFTLLRFNSVPVNRRGGGSVSGNVLAPTSITNTVNPLSPIPTATTFFDIGAYQVYGGCTGFSMNIPWFKNGAMVGGAFEGVFAAGDFSRFYILSTNTTDTPFNFTKIP